MTCPRLEIAKFPRNAVCAVTTSWDDNSKADTEISEILDSVRMKGTFYVDPEGPSRNLKGTFYEDQRNPEADPLTDPQLQTLARDHEVGSHTWSHVKLTSCSPEEAREELILSKEYLEKVTSRSVLGLAYPYGKNSGKIQRLANQCGYLFARTTQLGQVSFPPTNPYSWGVSVEAITRSGLPEKLITSRLFSNAALAYLLNLTSDSMKLALGLFEKARLHRGVWHLFGHSSEALKPKNREQFLDLCHYVARRDDVWYATNGMLFLCEARKRNASIVQSRHGQTFVYEVRVVPYGPPISGATPLPLQLVMPEKWSSSFRIDVDTFRSGSFEMGDLQSRTWIDVYGNRARVEVECG